MYIFFNNQNMYRFQDHFFMTKVTQLIKSNILLKFKEKRTIIFQLTKNY